MSAEDAAAAERLEDRVAELDAKIFHWLARRREARIEAGRGFNELKKLLGHGKWQRHFKETFASCGITLRTAERWMKLASKEDAKAKNDSSSILEPATDPDALKIKQATEQAEAEVAAAPGHKPKKDRRQVYQLPLRMTDEQRDAMDALRKSPQWPHAEEQIIRLLRRLWTKYAIVNKDGRRRS